MEAGGASNRKVQKQAAANEPIGPVGFVGLGNLGGAVAPNLLAAGFDLVVYDLDAAQARELVARGARLANDLEDLSVVCEVIILALPGPTEVAEVASKLLERMRPGSSLISISTVSPGLIRDLNEAGSDHRVAVIDAPIAGGVARARQGLVTIMVGAEAEAFDRCRPVLEAFGRTIVHVGPVGTGTVAKLVVNMLWFIHVVALSDALAIAARAGVAPRKLAEILPGTTYHGVADHDLFNLVRGVDDRTFTLALSCKDLRLISDLADEVGVGLPGLAALARDRFERAAESLGPEAGALHVTRLAEQAAGVSIRSRAKRAEIDREEG